MHIRLTAVAIDDFGLMPADAIARQRPDAYAECLGYGFLRGKARREFRCPASAITVAVAPCGSVPRIGSCGRRIRAS